MMGKMIVKILKKLKRVIFDRYILIISVPLGFILEFIITSPFLIFCCLDNFFNKKTNSPDKRS
jgi:hypothetical protein